MQVWHFCFVLQCFQMLFLSFSIGIDLSECLQYPDFSVVVLYKKVIIAFGFMVPDVKYNEAYISFLLVHPEWRRAGIATFMIYHLIQVMEKIPCLLRNYLSLWAHMQILESKKCCSFFLSLSHCWIFAYTPAHIVHCQQLMWTFMVGNHFKSRN